MWSEKRTQMSGQSCNWLDWFSVGPQIPSIPRFCMVPRQNFDSEAYCIMLTSTGIVRSFRKWPTPLASWLVVEVSLSEKHCYNPFTLSM